MRNLLRLAFVLAMALAALPARAVISCSVASNPVDLKVIYANPFANADLVGSLNIACTRSPTDPRRPWLWIGMTQTTAGRTATLDTGGSTIGYELYHSTGAAGTWLNTGAVAAGSTTNGAVRDRVDFGGGGSTSLTDSYVLFMRVPAFQFRAAGVYVDSVPVTIRLDNETGSVVTTGTLNVYISIPKVCRFSTPPTPISVNYTAFSPAPVTATSNFAITCTQGTNYTLSLDQARSVIPNVELAYGLTLNATASTGTATAQPYTLGISVDAGQPGRCNVSTCSGTDTRTLTITY